MPARPPTPKKPRARGWRSAGLLLAGLLLVLAIGIGGGLWWLGTPSGLQFALRQAQSVVAGSGGELVIEDARGGLYRGVELASVEFRSGGTTVTAREVVARWSLSQLLQGHLSIERLVAASLRIVLPEAEPEPEPEPKGPTPMPPSFALPVTLDLQRFAIGELRLSPGAADAGEDIVARDLRGALAYRDGSFTLSGLGLSSGYGALDAGRLVLGAEPPHAIDASLKVSGELEAKPYALALTASGDLERLGAEVSAAAAGAAVKVEAVLAPLATMPLLSARADWQRLDLNALMASLPTTRIDGRLSLEPDPAAAAPGTPPSAGAPGTFPAWAGDISLVNAEPGPIDAKRLPVARFSTQLRIADATEPARLRVVLSDIALALDGGGAVSGSIEVAPGRTLPVAGIAIPETVAALKFQAIDAAGIAAAMPPTALDGTLELGRDAFELDLAQGAQTTRELLPDAFAAASGPATIRVKGRIDDQAVQLEEARLQLGDNRLQASGSAGIVAPYRIDLRGSAADIRPQQWLPRELAADERLRDALINGDWSVRGLVTPAATGGADGADGAAEEAPPQVDALATLSLDDSRLAGKPLTARIGTRLVTGGAVPARIEQTEAELRLGANRIRLAGALGRAGDRLEIDADIDEPQAIEPRLRGSIDLAGGLSGAFDALLADMELRGERLSFRQPDGDLSIRTISLDARLPVALEVGAAAPLDMKLAVNGVQAAGRTLSSAKLSTEGSVGAHRFSVSAAGQGRSLQLAGRGSASLAGEPSWKATLEKANVGGELVVSLRAPATLEIAATAAKVRNLALAVADGELSIKVLDARWAGTPQFNSQGALRDLPVTRLLELSGNDASFDSLRGLRLDGDWSLAGSGASDLSGHAGIALREEAVSGIVPLGLGGAAASGKALADDGFAGNGVRVEFDRGRLDGRIDLRLPSLAFTHPLTASDLVLDGRVAIDGTIGGTTSEPRIDALLTGSELQVLRRSVGWRLRDGELAARLTGREVELQTLRFASGEGSVMVSGRAALREAAPGTGTASAAGAATPGSVPFDGRFTAKADRFMVPIGPGQSVVVSGTSELSSAATGLELSGALAVDKGIVELQGSAAPALPADVVLVGLDEGRPGAGPGPKGKPAPAPDEAADAPPMSIESDLNVSLGDDLRVTGKGIEARLTGELHIGGALPADPQISGLVMIMDGSYQAYGQNLQIESGTVRFNGPADNPVLDIVAKRPFLPVEVGVSVTGTARSPVIELVSEPDMAQADQLSWLVLGVSPDKAPSAAQSLALRQAATQLLGRDDGPRKPGVAERLGLDVFNFGYGSDTGPEQGVTETSAQTQLPGASQGGGANASDAPGDVVTLGKRFSDRLFISYEQGLRGVSNLLRAQYKLTDRLSLRAQSGTASALDLLYILAFD